MQENEDKTPIYDEKTVDCEDIPHDASQTEPLEGASQTELAQDAERQEEPPRGRQGRRERRKAESELPHIDNRSFLALLLRSFLSFTVITVAVVALIFFIAMWASNNDKININIQSIATYDQELRNNTTSPSIPYDIILGVGGWMDIVDEDGEVVYTTLRSDPHTYTAGELACITEYQAGATVRSVRFATPDRGYNYFVSITYEGDREDEFLLLDSDLNILYGTVAALDGKASLTQSEYDFLIYNQAHDGDILEKYRFEDGEGKVYYAVYLDCNNDEITPPWLFIVIVLLGIFGILVASIIMYVRYINKHVQRPLKALSSAMEEFANGGYRQQLSYEGSIEFEQLVDSFNEMVVLLNASEEQRKEIEQDRQRMLAGLSHDLKTPMTVILGFSKAIKDGMVSEEDKAKYLSLIMSKAEHMSELVNELYEYSELEHPDFALACEETDIAEFVRSFYAERYDEFELRGYGLEPNLSEDRLQCMLDKAQFTRVLENLTGNFFKYTPAGSTLYVGAQAEGDFALVTIADDGGGIEPDARKDIFVPFVVGEQSRLNQGSGLGLAVCKKVVEAHGGSIALADPPPEGRSTAFEIRIPLANRP